MDGLFGRFSKAVSTYFHGNEYERKALALEREEERLRARGENPDKSASYRKMEAELSVLERKRGMPSPK